MTGWKEVPNLVMCAAALLMMAQGLFVVSIIPSLDRWNRRFFITFFSILVLYSASCLTDTIVYMYRNMALAERISVYLESLLPSVLMPMLTVHLLRASGEDWRKSALFRVVMVLWIVYFILLDITQFTTFIYYITPDNQYYRGPWYPLLLIPPMAIMLINLSGVIRRRKKLPRKHFDAYLVYLTGPTVAMFVQMFVFGLLFVVIGTAVAALSMFSIILSDQIDQHMRQQREIANQRASIMVLQMRPHFICNTMMAIYCLCDQDPKEAQRVIQDFTAYLRKNFTAIANKEPIPFTEELEHTRAYLAVCQAQYDGSLFVEYDTPHIRFRLPPLTLQPIVENAVIHGRDPDSEPLRIVIQTRETEAGSVILVEDNGPGFEAADNNEPHIALANIRQRLEMMCGGHMSITLRKGGGTAVKVTIPQIHSQPA